VTSLIVEEWRHDHRMTSTPPDPLERWSMELFGLGLEELRTALEKIAPADHRQWLDSRLAGQGFTRDARGNLTFSRTP
jgi:hypothetical protein